MKKSMLIVTALCCVHAAISQTLNVVVGEVTYQVPAAQAGDMLYDDGATLTIMGKTFKISEIDNMYVDATAVTDNTVSVVYSGNAAAVTVAGNVMKNLDVVAKGADVSIVQGSDQADEITYTLSGQSSDGSFYMDGELKASFVLNGLSLTNADGYAIRIDDGKRISIELADGTANTLADGTSGDQKGCLMVNGHTELRGGGTLNLTGNMKHAFWGDEYVEVKKTAGTINVLKAVGDGFNVNQYFKMNGGTVTLKNIGDDGISVAMDGKGDADDGKVIIKGGTLDIAATAAGAKAITCDSTMLISGGTLTLSANGAPDTSDATDYAYAACLKSGIGVEISGGELTMSCSGAGSRVVNSDGYILLSGGTVKATSTGAIYGSGSNIRKAGGIKADGDVTISDEADVTVTTSGAGSKGIKADGVLTISGGKASATTSGGYCGSGTDLSGCAGFKGGTVVISGGTVTAQSSGQGGKGISSDNTIDISDGDVTVTVTGTNYNKGGTYSKAAKGIKADGAITISGGTVKATADYHESIESKTTLTIKGGMVTGISNADDGINCTKDMTISGGTVYAVASGTKASSSGGGGGFGPGGGGGGNKTGDALDANGNIRLSGGTVVAIGSRTPECGIDANEEGGATVYFTGGQLFGIGGNNSHPTKAQSTQCYVTTSGGVSANSTVTLKSGNTVLASFQMPAYSFSNGSIIVTAPGMTAGNSYTVTLGNTSKTAKATQYSSGGMGW